MLTDNGAWMAREWNANHEAGDEVEVTLDDGSLRRTRTRSEAWVLGGGVAVVQVDGISGGYSLGRVRAV